MSTTRVDEFMGALDEYLEDFIAMETTALSGHDSGMRLLERRNRLALAAQALTGPDLGPTRRDGGT